MRWGEIFLELILGDGVAAGLLAPGWDGYPFPAEATGHPRRAQQERESSGLQLGLHLTSIPCSELKLTPGPARCPDVPLSSCLLQEAHWLPTA